MEEELRAAEEADRRKQEEGRIKALAAAAPPPQLSASDSSPAPAGARLPSASASTEGLYGMESADTTPAVSDSAPATSELAPTLPRIHPPATGETIAAARPGIVATQIKTPAPEPGLLHGDASPAANGAVVPAQGGPSQAEPSTEFLEKQFPTEPVTHND
jgi:hypothetical protein